MRNGALQRNLDAVLVRWVIRNQGRAAQPVGLRTMIDTLIGGNDGVPFTIPGRAGLVDTHEDFRKADDVPDFIQALERPNLNNPGTVAHMTLKVGSEIEPPSRATLTAWKARGGISALAGSLQWEIPVTNIGSDSAVVLYWPEKMLAANETRTIGFAYGLGNVSSNDKLGLTLGGSFEPGQLFTATAYVENPVPGQTLRLELPEGLSREEGAETQNVVMPKVGKTSIVTWKIKVEHPGEFRLKVLSSTGLSQSKTISIVREAVGKLRLELPGPIELGQAFTVIGRVSEPVAKQTLTLHLPRGMVNLDSALTQSVPAPPAESKESTVQWKVRIPESGKYQIRVSSSTGVTQAKTISIEQTVREGMFKINLGGEFAPGKIFMVSTSVAEPVPDQKLTLMLPAGLERVEGDETQSPQAKETISWKVKIHEIGKHTVGVKSSTGITQRKTLQIEPPGDQPGRFTFAISGLTRPGKAFSIKAEVTNPVAGQTLTLVLKEGLQLAGSEATQPVPQTVTADGVSLVSWEVIATRSGLLPVRIESSTKLARTKTIDLRERPSSLFGQTSP
jgi:predicted secreted protein